VTPDVVVDWLSKNDAYAKSIVQLAGIRVGEVKIGIPVRVEAFWTGTEFKAPLVFSIPLEEGTLTWSGLTTHTALFRKTLGLLTETFASMLIPERVVVFEAEINLENKKTYFKSFQFGKSHAVPSHDLIILNKTIGDFGAMQAILHKFVGIRKKLKGIGFDGA